MASLLSRRARLAVFLVVLSAVAMIVSAQAQGQFTLSTDKSVYNAGDTVTVTIQPAIPGVGVSYWLLVTKPDSSQTRINLVSGQTTATLVAAVPVGQDRVELWGQVTGTGSPLLYATVSFTVNSQFTISTDKSLYLVGENVTITIQPTPAIGVSYWLNITRPDGSQKRVNLSSGQGKATLVAEAPVGQDRVELWGQVTGTGTPQLFATAAFAVASSRIPGFPIESLLAGIAVGVFLTVAGRRLRSRHQE